MWPSVVYQPAALAKSAFGAKVWERAAPLPASEKKDYAAAAASLEGPLKRRTRANTGNAAPAPAE